MHIQSLCRTDNQRTVVVLQGSQEFSMEVRYEPAQHSLRVLHAGVQRLFFYEPDDFFPSKASLLNEYGLLVGKLQLRNGTKGSLQFYDTKLSFLLQPEERTVIMQHPGLPETLTWDYASIQHADTMFNPDMFRALLMILAWSVTVPALQA